MLHICLTLGFSIKYAKGLLFLNHHKCYNMAMNILLHSCLQGFTWFTVLYICSIKISPIKSTNFYPAGLTGDKTNCSSIGQ